MTDEKIIEILKENYEVKNYRELCELLGWKISAGDSKKAQLGDLNRYCKYHNEGHKFIIDKVYDIPIPKLKKGKFVKDIELILLNILSNTEGCVYQSTMNNLMRVLDIVNDNYLKGVSDKSLLSDRFNIEERYVNEVYYILSRYKSIIKNALRDLENKCLISVSERNVICYTDNGEIKYKDATIEEEEYILEIEKIEMEKLNVHNRIFFYLNSEANKLWRHNIGEALRDKNINYMFKIYDIVFTRKFVIKELKSRECLELRRRLNNNVLESVIKSINKRNKDIPDDLREMIDCDIYAMEDVLNMYKWEDEKTRVSDGYIDKCTKIAKKIVIRDLRTRDKI